MSKQLLPARFAHFAHPCDPNIRQSDIHQSIHYFIPIQVWRPGAKGWSELNLSPERRNMSTCYCSVLQFIGEMQRNIAKLGTNTGGYKSYTFDKENDDGTVDNIQKILTIVQLIVKRTQTARNTGVEFVQVLLPEHELYDTNNQLGVLISIISLDPNLRVIDLVKRLVTEIAEDKPDDERTYLIEDTSQNKKMRLLESVDNSDNEENLEGSESGNRSDQEPRDPSLGEGISEGLDDENQAHSSSERGGSSSNRGRGRGRGGRGRGRGRGNGNRSRRGGGGSGRGRGRGKGKSTRTKAKQLTEKEHRELELINMYKRLDQLRKALGIIIGSSTGDDRIIQSASWVSRRVLENAIDSGTNPEVLLEHALSLETALSKIKAIAGLGCTSEQLDIFAYQQRDPDGEDDSVIFKIPVPRLAWYYSPEQLSSTALMRSTFPWKSSNQSRMFASIAARFLGIPIDSVLSGTKAPVAVYQSRQLQAMHDNASALTEHLGIVPPGRCGAVPGVDPGLEYLNDDYSTLRELGIDRIESAVRPLGRVVNSTIEFVRSYTNKIEHTNDELIRKYQFTLTQNSRQKVQRPDGQRPTTTTTAATDTSTETGAARHRHKRSSSSRRRSSSRLPDDSGSDSSSSSSSSSSYTSSSEDESDGDKDTKPDDGDTIHQSAASDKGSHPQSKTVQWGSGGDEEENDVRHDIHILQEKTRVAKDKCMKAISAIRNAAMSEFVSLLDPASRIPDSLKACALWTERRDNMDLGYFVHSRDIGTFGQVMSTICADLKIYGISTNQWIVMLLLLARDSIYLMKKIKKLGLHVKIAGAFAGGKSKALETMVGCSVPGTTEMVTGASNQGMLPIHVDQDHPPGDFTHCYDELPPLVTMPTKKLSVADQRVARMFSSMMTSGEIFYRTNAKKNDNIEGQKISIEANVGIQGAANDEVAGNMVDARMINVKLIPNVTTGPRNTVNYICAPENANGGGEQKKDEIVTDLRKHHSLVFLTCKTIESTALPVPNNDLLCVYLESAVEYLSTNRPDICKKIRLLDVTHTMAAVLAVWHATALVFSKGFGGSESAGHFEYSKIMNVLPYLHVNEDIAFFVVAYAVYTAMEPLGHRLLRWVSEQHGSYPFVSWHKDAIKLEALANSAAEEAAMEIQSEKNFTQNNTTTLGNDTTSRSESTSRVPSRQSDGDNIDCMTPDCQTTDSQHVPTSVRIKVDHNDDSDGGDTITDDNSIHNRKRKEPWLFTDTLGDIHMIDHDNASDGFDMGSNVRPANESPHMSSKNIAGRQDSTTTIKHDTRSGLTGSSTAVGVDVDDDDPVVLYPPTPESDYTEVSKYIFAMQRATIQIPIATESMQKRRRTTAATRVGRGRIGGSGDRNGPSGPQLDDQQKAIADFLEEEGETMEYPEKRSEQKRSLSKMADDIVNCNKTAIYEVKRYLYKTYNEQRGVMGRLFYDPNYLAVKGSLESFAKNFTIANPGSKINPQHAYTELQTMVGKTMPAHLIPLIPFEERDMLLPYIEKYRVRLWNDSRCNVVHSAPIIILGSMRVYILIEALLDSPKNMTWRVLHNLCNKTTVKRSVIIPIVHKNAPHLFSVFEAHPRNVELTCSNPSYVGPKERAILQRGIVDALECSSAKLDSTTLSWTPDSERESLDNFFKANGFDKPAGAYTYQALYSEHIASAESTMFGHKKILREYPEDLLEEVAKFDHDASTNMALMRETPTSGNQPGRLRDMLWTSSSSSSTTDSKPIIKDQQYVTPTPSQESSPSTTTRTYTHARNVFPPAGFANVMRPIKKEKKEDGEEDSRHNPQKQKRFAAANVFNKTGVVS